VSTPAAPAIGAETSADKGFHVTLSNFEGPFDLLLQLIFAHRLDVTEVALHTVTDEFIAYTREIGRVMELDETTTFLVIAATLLDLKAARLLPAGEVADEEDLALLEVRDLLFARLLQYRAYKHVAGMFAELEAAGALLLARSEAGGEGSGEVEVDVAGDDVSAVLQLGIEDLRHLGAGLQVVVAATAVDGHALHEVFVVVEAETDGRRRHARAAQGGGVADQGSGAAVAFGGAAVGDDDDADSLEGGVGKM
jgi:hypothetical protein